VEAQFVRRDRGAAALTIERAFDGTVGAGGRLTQTAARFTELVPSTAPSPAFRAERVAQTIRDHHGSVWQAVLDYGISYSHACRIRAGWRPGGRRAEPIERVQNSIPRALRSELVVSQDRPPIRSPARQAASARCRGRL
jgi:hypothetical protein